MPTLEYICLCIVQMHIYIYKYFHASILLISAVYSDTVKGHYIRHLKYYLCNVITLKLKAMKVCEEQKLTNFNFNFFIYANLIRKWKDQLREQVIK